MRVAMKQVLGARLTTVFVRQGHYALESADTTIDPAPDTIDTIPEKTLRAFAEHGELKGVMAEDGGDAEAVLARFTQAGIDVDALADAS